MADLTGFNANEYPDDAFVIEAGDYLAALVESDLKPTKKDPSVAYLYLKFEIISEGKYRGKKIEERLNIRHGKEDVRQIANQKLAALCKAVGVISPKDSSDLHNKPVGLIVKVSDTEYNGEKRKQNTIAGFLSKDQYAKRKASAAATTATAPAWMQPRPGENN